jgi:preprotein translocase subunit SecD
MNARRLALLALCALLSSNYCLAADALSLRVAEASRGVSPDGAATLNVRLSQDSGHLFGEWTSRHVGEKVDILIDGRVVLSPRVLDPITGGAMQLLGPSADEIDALIPKLLDGRSALSVETRD